jgi:hypothetical protein
MQRGGRGDPPNLNPSAQPSRASGDRVRGAETAGKEGKGGRHVNATVPGKEYG